VEEGADRMGAADRVEHLRKWMSVHMNTCSYVSIA
jgi:hypothetical protein